MSDTETRTETKAERKERRRLKRLRKEKKRKLKELKAAEGGDDEMGAPKSKKMKLDDSRASDNEKEEETVPNGDAAGHGDDGDAAMASNLEGIAKSIVSATKQQLQNALLLCAKQSPSSIEDITKNLEATEMDEDLKTLLAASAEATEATETAETAGASLKATEGRTTGVVLKWAHEKGFGFIKRDDTGEDIFCHKNEVWSARGAPPGAMCGAKVEFIVATEDKGQKATEVTAIGGGDCPSGRQAKGTVNNYLPDRGFGFITGDDGGEYFVGDRDLWEASGTLEQGARVEFDIKTKDDGRQQAIYCTLEGGRLLSCQTCGGVGHMSRDCTGGGEEW